MSNSNEATFHFVFLPSVTSNNHVLISKRRNFSYLEIDEIIYFDSNNFSINFRYITSGLVYLLTSIWGQLIDVLFH